ncbi:hypothetical protein [Acuticoccus sp.]|uniref:hypothetical protein n=1 Tax=Acuticoccus sp. TaxID=1904378 RepID=UPI003B51BF1C
MFWPRTSTAEVLDVRNLYEAGIVSRPQAIRALVSLGYAPSSAAAIFGDPGRARAAALTGLIGDGPPNGAAAEYVPRYPSNVRVDKTESLSQRVRDLTDLLERRVRRQAQHRNLLVYDGSIFDQLVHTLIASVLPHHSYEVICALRPCMEEELQKEVKTFATHHGYETLGYSGDCQVDFAKLQIASPRCSNLTGRIAAFFDHEGGALFVGGASTDDHLLEIGAVSEFYGRSVLQYEDLTGDVLWETSTQSGASFRTVLLLHGLMPYEIVACAIALLSYPPKPWHVPECYLPCYSELEKRRVRTVIERCSPEIEEALCEQGGTGDNMKPHHVACHSDRRD